MIQLIIRAAFEPSDSHFPPSPPFTPVIAIITTWNARESLNLHYMNLIPDLSFKKCTHLK